MAVRQLGNRYFAGKRCLVILHTIEMTVFPTG
jgi:hypothetical protein